MKMPHVSPESAKSSNPVASRFRNQRRDLCLRTSRGDKTRLELFFRWLSGWTVNLAIFV